MGASGVVGGLEWACGGPATVKHQKLVERGRGRGTVDEKGRMWSGGISAEDRGDQ